MKSTAPITTTLAAALRAAADELRVRQPPPGLQRRVLAAARQARAKRTAVEAATPRRWAWAGAAVCASVLAGSALLMLRLPPPAAQDEAPRLGGGFVPLAEPDRWPRDAAPAWLIATELSGARLAALGLPYDPTRAGATVRAELLMRESGEVLAVRLLP